MRLARVRIFFPKEKTPRRTAYGIDRVKICGKISAQPHTIVKQICLPNGNLLFLSLFSLSKN